MRAFQLGETLTIGEKTGYAVADDRCGGCIFHKESDGCTASAAKSKVTMVCGPVKFVTKEQFLIRRLKGEV